MATELPALGARSGAPMPAAGRAVPIRESAVLTAAWVTTPVFSVEDARRLTLFCSYNADASGTGNRAQIRVMCSSEYDSDGSAPEVGDDVWYMPTIVDSTPTTTDLTGTIESGGDMSLVNHSVVVARPIAITLGDAADAGTDKYRMAITIDVTPYHWCYVAAKELGDTDAGDLGVLAIMANLAQ